MKYATDVTEQKLTERRLRGQIEAIGKSQAVIEFNMDGTIVDGQRQFPQRVGYTLDEIKGQHHSMFVDPIGARQRRTTANSGPELNRGEYQAAEYKRIGKGGKEVWIQARTTRSSISTASRSRS